MLDAIQGIARLAGDGLEIGAEQHPHVLTEGAQLLESDAQRGAYGAARPVGADDVARSDRAYDTAAPLRQLSPYSTRTDVQVGELGVEGDLAAVSADLLDQKRFDVILRADGRPGRADRQCLLRRGVRGRSGSTNRVGQRLGADDDG
jgi:hypothetical protein